MHPYPSPARSAYSAIAAAGASYMNAALKESGYIGEATSSAPAISSQWNASRTLLKRKRKSKRAVKKQLRWKRFTAKVEKAINQKVLGNRAVVHNSVGNHASIAGGQGVTTVELLPANGNAAGINQDLLNIFQIEGLTAGTSEIYVKSGRLDVTLKNNNADETAIVEAYQLSFRNMPDDYNPSGTDVTSMLALMEAAMSLQAVASSRLNTTEIGWTPFVDAEVVKYVNVINHTRFILGSGQHQTYTLKDTYNKTFNLNQVSDVTVIPYQTKCVLFIISGRPNTAALTGDMVGHYPAVGIDFEWNRSYWYQRITNNQAYAAEG